jgi:hypothetical protein
MTGDTTIRTSSTTLLSQVRNLNNRIALLTLRRINRTHSTADLQEIERLQKKVDQLMRRMTEIKYLTGRPQQ